MKKILLVVLALICLTLMACKERIESPPLIYLQQGDTLYDGFQGPYCWDSGSGAALCVDPIPPQFDETPTLAAGDGINLLLDTPLPDSVTLSLSNELFGDAVASESVPVAEDITWIPQVEPGQYILAVSASWKQGDVTYWYSISIE